MFALCRVLTALSANDLGDMSSRMRLRTGSDTESPNICKPSSVLFRTFSFALKEKVHKPFAPKARKRASRTSREKRRCEKRGARFTIDNKKPPRKAAAGNNAFYFISRRLVFGVTTSSLGSVNLRTPSVNSAEMLSLSMPSRLKLLEYEP